VRTLTVFFEDEFTFFGFVFIFASSTIFTTLAFVFRLQVSKGEDFGGTMMKTMD